MNRFVTCVLAVTCGAALLVLVGERGTAAPVPKGASPPDPTPDLKALLEVVDKAARGGKWPAEVDEKKLRGSVQNVLDRALKAGEQNGRKLPIDFDKLTRADAVKQYTAAVLKGGFVIAGDVQVTSAHDSVIFASGDVRVTAATNCVIVARNVRCTVTNGCVVVADECIRLTSACARKGEEGSVLVAGRWVRATSLDGAVCHVLRPGTDPAPDEGKLNGPRPAIRVTAAKNVVFLNAKDATGATTPDNCTYLPQTAQLAK